MVWKGGKGGGKEGGKRLIGSNIYKIIELERSVRNIPHILKFNEIVLESHNMYLNYYESILSSQSSTNRRWGWVRQIINSTPLWGCYMSNQFLKGR